jgi:hypothetical protein
LQEHRAALAKLTDELIEHETVTGDVVKAALRAPTLAAA